MQPRMRSETTGTDRPPARPWLTRRRQQHATETGMVTSEYAIGTVGAACIGCAVLLLGQDGFWSAMIQTILQGIEGLLPLVPALPFPPVLL